MRVRRAVALLVLCPWPLVASAQPAQPVPPPAQEIEECLGCHGDPGLTMTLGDGSTQALHVDGEALARSVHAGKLRCTDCHPGMAELPHPERPRRNAVEFAAGFREACKSCHFETYTKLLDSSHFALQAKGVEGVPGCLECHGAHGVMDPSTPRTQVSDTCAACHSEVAERYGASVHGRGLQGKAAADVPVCTDCHRSHDLAGPSDRSWLSRTHEVCGSCHGDKERMKRHGLSADVMQTYLADFHGATATLGQARPEDGTRVTALCTDCHGVHDIARVDDPKSPVLRANLAKTCRKCHPGATDDFPAAWLSHYEPSWERAPLVYATKLFYKVLVPFIIGGLVLQVLLHFWRVVVNR